MPQDRKQKLAKILAMVRSVPEGAALLDQARLQQTRIVLADSKSIGGVQGVTAERTPRGRSLADSLYHDGPKKYLVQINEKLPLRQSAEVLAHELRHLWQTGFVAMTPGLGASPRIRVAHERLLEGDAEAFAALFRARLENRAFTVRDWKKLSPTFRNRRWRANMTRGSWRGRRPSLPVRKIFRPACAAGALRWFSTPAPRAG